MQQLQKKKLQKKKFRNKEFNIFNSKLVYGLYGIQLYTKGLLTYNQIEASRKIIAKAIKGIGRLWVRFWPQRTVTKKPLGLRMGKGKGPVVSAVFEVKAGTVLFEISRVLNDSMIQAALLLALQKLPIKGKIVKKKN